jgi:hypothetical protein
MAITRTQIAKQLLAQGGRTGFQGGGADMGGVADSQGNVGSSSGGNEGGYSPPDDRSTAQQTANTKAAIAEAQRANRIADIEKFIDRPPVGFTNAAKVNLLSPSSLAKTAFGALIGIPGLGFLSNINVNPNPTGDDDDDDDDDRGNGDGQSIILPPIMAQAPSTTEQEPEVEKEEEPFELSRRFRAEGGIMNSDVVGGEFDFESARQMYGLGKLVKKVTRSVKKIAKSPIGKAALAAATIKFGGPLAAKVFPSTFGTTASSPFLRSIGRGQFFGDTGIFSAGKNLLFGTDAGIRSTPGLFSKIPGGGVTAAIAGTSLLAGLLTPEQEEEAQDLARGEGIDIDAARRSILSAGTQDDFRARRFRAEGGSMKEPVAKKTMPLLDMGGKEMDLRAEGGFVPIGRMEKADDVPARLSKNEFVFTADAVRNAGDGSVDKGAEVMYNMMKNLESGGDVSEESQGLEGARKMFQTSQRLEEVL